MGRTSPIRKKNALPGRAWHVMFMPSSASVGAAGTAIEVIPAGVQAQCSPALAPTPPSPPLRLYDAVPSLFQIRYLT